MTSNKSMSFMCKPLMRMMLCVNNVNVFLSIMIVRCLVPHVLVTCSSFVTMLQRIELLMRMWKALHVQNAVSKQRHITLFLCVFT